MLFIVQGTNHDNKGENMRRRICDHCKKEIPSKDKYIKCVEVGEASNRKNNWTRTMFGAGDLCLKCFSEVVKK